MTSADIVQELRSTQPVAPDALRVRIAAIAERPRATPRRLFPSLRGSRRPLLIAVPALAAVVIATTAGIALNDDRAVERSAAKPVPGANDYKPLPETALDQAQAKAAGAVAIERAQSFAATLSLSVADNDELARGAQRAIAVADELGGFVVGSQVTTGTPGYAAITMKVPFAQAREAVARLSRIGTIVAQDVRIQDLQETLDTLDRQTRVAQRQLVAVLTRLARDDLDSIERSRLEARRDALREELRVLRSGRSATAAQARLATIQLDVTTREGSGVAVPGSRIDRTLDRALEILAWEGAIAAAVLIVAAPFAIFFGALWLGRRTLRRRADEQLLST